MTLPFVSSVRKSSARLEINAAMSELKKATLKIRLCKYSFLLQLRTIFNVFFNNRLNEKYHRYLPTAEDWQMSVLGVASSSIAKTAVR